MIAGIVIVFYVLGIVSAVNAIMSARTPQGAVAWAVALESFPFVAESAYAIFGRDKFEGTLQAYEERKDEIDTLIADFRTNLEPWSLPDEDDSHYEAITSWASSMSRITSECTGW